MVKSFYHLLLFFFIKQNKESLLLNRVGQPNGWVVISQYETLLHRMYFVKKCTIALLELRHENYKHKHHFKSRNCYKGHSQRQNGENEWQIEVRFCAARTLQPVFCQRMQKTYSAIEWQKIILRNEIAKTNAMEKWLFQIRNNNVMNRTAMLYKTLLKKWHLLTASFILFVLTSESKQPTDWGSKIP